VSAALIILEALLPMHSLSISISISAVCWKWKVNACAAALQACHVDLIAASSVSSAVHISNYNHSRRTSWPVIHRSEHTLRSETVVTKEGAKASCAHRVTGRPQSSTCVPDPTCAPISLNRRHHALYTPNSPCVALCVGFPSFAFTRASSGEFLTGMYVAHTYNTLHSTRSSYVDEQQDRAVALFMHANKGARLQHRRCHSHAPHCRASGMFMWQERHAARRRV
jgi:hypothetical protein